MKILIGLLELGTLCIEGVKKKLIAKLLICTFFLGYYVL